MYKSWGLHFLEPRLYYNQDWNQGWFNLVTKNLFCRYKQKKWFLWDGAQQKLLKTMETNKFDLIFATRNIYISSNLNPLLNSEAVA